MKNKAYWIWLAGISGIGAKRVKKLLDYFKEPKGIWEAGREEINRVEGIGPKLSRQIIVSRRKFDFEAKRKKLKEFGIKVVTWADKCYPKQLREIYNAPPVLYYRGSIKGLGLPCVSIVGTRRCTDYGRGVARKLARELAGVGIPIISGLARGIDTTAHQGALETGITYAILGSGLDITYPPENKKLKEKIENQGGVISSFPPGEEPLPKNFPARNRIISGLARGVVVIEAPEKSGALITADFALEQGREVMAVPGDIAREQSQGTNKLIKKGAKIVRQVEDIVEELSFGTGSQRKNIREWDFSAKKTKSPSLSPKADQVYDLLSSKPRQFERLLEEVNFNSQQLNSLLLKLEIKGLVSRLPGRKFKVKI